MGVEVEDTSLSLPSKALVGVTLKPARSEPESFSSMRAASLVLTPM